MKTLALETTPFENSLRNNQELLEKCQRASHDLRSPLSSLNLVLSKIESIPDSHKELIQLSLQRINDIARDLMLDYKLKSNHTSQSETKSTITSIVSSVIKEKKFEYQNYSQIEFKFESHIDPNTLCKIKPCLLQRILSNLVNNSVEAMNSKVGTIKILLFRELNQLRLVVQDDGDGIPENIIPLLGHKMVSFGKAQNSISEPLALSSGNGIGIYSAKKYLQQVGGNLEFFSKVGIGTSVVIQLPIIDSI